MRNKYSKSKFFQKFPSIIQTYFQGSESTNREDVENLFEIASGKLQLFRDKKVKENDLPKSMIFFDELGLAERSPSNPLKVLHSKLEDNNKINDISFVGISNWILDASKNNRTLYSSVPNLDELIDDLVETSCSIAKSINKQLENNDIFKEIFPEVYFKYKNITKLIKKLTVYQKYIIFEIKKSLQGISKNELIKEFGNEINNENITYDSFKKI